MLSHRNDIKDPRFHFIFSVAIYGFTIAVIYSSIIVLLTFVSATGVLFAFMKFVNPSAVASSKVVVDEYLPVLCKFLKSPKQKVRAQSSSILQYLAQAAIDQGQEESLCKLVDVVADTKGLTQPHQRQIVYHTLYQIGTKITLSGASITVAKGTASAVLSGVGVPLAKEAKAAPPLTW